MALVWGSGFVAQSEGMKFIGANTFNGIRMLIGSVIILPFACLSGRKSEKPTQESRRALIISGVVCGAVLCAASTIQTWGLAYTTAGKSGFITAMYMIFVPIISIVIGKRISGRTIGCAFIALFGMYLLCLYGTGIKVNRGDALTLVCALLFSVHILLVDRFTSNVNALRFSCLQFFVCGVINIILMFIVEKPSLDVILSCAVPILYSGCFSCGIGYTLQPIGQRYAEPTTASILMSFESVFALIFGILIQHDPVTAHGLLGCAIMFAAIIIIQLPERRKKVT